MELPSLKAGLFTSTSFGGQPISDNSVEHGKGKHDTKIVPAGIK
jgi:hypothetical protein